jgi:hypothetical protein
MYPDEIFLRLDSVSLVEAVGSESAALIKLTLSNSVTKQPSSNFMASQISNSVRYSNLHLKKL